MFLNNLSIARRLAVVLATMLALSLVMTTMVVDNLKVERAASDWLRHASEGTDRSAAIARSSDPSLGEYFADSTRQLTMLATARRKIVEVGPETAEERAVFQRVAEARRIFLASRDEIKRLRSAGDAAGAAREVQEHFEKISHDYIAGIEAVAERQRRDVDIVAKRIDLERDHPSALLAASGAVSLAIGALLAWLLSRGITRPLSRAGTMAHTIAQMDLTDRAAASYANDETGCLLRSVDTMRGALTQALLQVRSVIDGISTASTQIATGNHDLSARTEHAAGNLEETAASMEELTATVHHGADTALQANQLAASPGEVARCGGGVVMTMGEINASPRPLCSPARMTASG